MAKNRKGRPKSAKKLAAEQTGSGSGSGEAAASGVAAPSVPAPPPRPAPKSSKKAAAAPKAHGFAAENVGSLLTILSAIGVFFLCALLPLVGRAGVLTAHYRANFLTFLAVLLVSLALAALGLLSKQKRRKIDQSPFPMVSAGLTGFYVILLLCLLTGMLGA